MWTMGSDRFVCTLTGAAIGAAAAYFYMKRDYERVVQERDGLLRDLRLQDREAMDQVSQLLQRGNSVSKRAKELIHQSQAKPLQNGETEEQHMRRTMPSVSPVKRIFVNKKGSGSGTFSLVRPKMKPGSLCIFINTACPFAQRAHIVALEKQLEFQVIQIETDPTVQPNWWHEVSKHGYLPAAQHMAEDSKKLTVISGSVEVSEWLDQTLPSQCAPLLPEEDELALEIGNIIKLFARRFVATGFRLLANQHPLRDQELGIAFEQACDWWDRVLSNNEGPFYFGVNFSMVECLTFPFVDRLHAILPAYRDFHLDQQPIGNAGATNAGLHRWPALMLWIDSCAERPSVIESRGTHEFYVESYSLAAGKRPRAWNQNIRQAKLF